MVLSLKRAARAFSLIELVIVVVIIGIIGAIAIPRMSRGVEGAGDSALTANLAILRGALDMFATEHGGRYPALTELPDALTQYSTEAGTAPYSPTKTTTHIYGPYVRAVPTLPVGANKGQVAFHTGVVGAAGFGWHYTLPTGALRANCTDPEADAKGKPYNTY